MFVDPLSITIIRGWMFRKLFDEQILYENSRFLLLSTEIVSFGIDPANVSLTEYNLVQQL